jgi:hypothetical protein
MFNLAAIAIASCHDLQWPSPRAPGLDLSVRKFNAKVPNDTAFVLSLHAMGVSSAGMIH